MPNKDNNTIEFNQKDYGKAPFVIYADLECLLEKIRTCYNNPEESSTTEINKHTPSGYSLFTNYSFDERKNKLDCYREKDCMKKFCKDLRKHATNIINCNKKELIPLTKKEESNYRKETNCQICKKGFINYDKKYYKVKDYCYYTGKYKGAAHNNCNLKYKVQKEIPIAFHNGSTYDYHFITEELAKEFDGNFECLGEKTEKYITFSVPIKKEIRNKDKIIEITYKLKFIDSFRFMSTSLSKLVDNLSEGLHNNRCVDCKSCLDYMKTKDDKLIFRCFSCKKNYEIDFNKEFIKRFTNTYKFCNNDLNRFIMLLRKRVYPYEYMDIWEKFDETSLPDKKSFYSCLTMDNISDFKLNNQGEYHDLYVQSDILLLVDVFENFRKNCIKVYELDPVNFLSLRGLAWQACLKKQILN